MDAVQGARPGNHDARHPSPAAGHGQGPQSGKTRAIAFGFQVVLGTLVNAILNDPGPVSLASKEMDTRLAGCLSLLLQAEVGHPAAR